MEQRAYEPLPETVLIDQLREALRGLMLVEAVNVLSGDKKPAVQFTGRLVEGDQDTIFDAIVQRFEALGYTPLLTAAEDEHRIRAVPVVVNGKTGKRWINYGLFVLTLLSTLYVGAIQEGVELHSLLDIWRGWPFAVTLLAILTAHELSHYFVGRAYGSPTSLPYFIPLPLAGSLGTFGAVIFQRGPMRSRKALFDIGISGPIGGLLVAIPLLFLGLAFSEVGTPFEYMERPVGEPLVVMQEGNSVLYMVAKLIVHGRILPDKTTGDDVWLSPPSPGGSVAFAAWAGLLVTMFNLFPIGQLDGGHVAYAMWGHKAWKIARYVVFAIYGWGFFLMVMRNPGGMTWFVAATLGTLMGPRHPPPLNDLTPLDAKRRTLGLVMVAVFLLIVVPIPWTTVVL